MTQPKKSISPLTVVLLLIIAGSVGVMFMTCQQTSDSFRRHDEAANRKVEKLQREYREKQNP
jgi:ABC-type cobalt transport system substrate-binding protein